MPSHQSLRCALGTLSDELGPRQIWQAQMRHLTSKSLLSTWSEMSGDYHNSRSPFAVRRLRASDKLWPSGSCNGTPEYA